MNIHESIQVAHYAYRCLKIHRPPLDNLLKMRHASGVGEFPFAGCNDYGTMVADATTPRISQLFLMSSRLQDPNAGQ